MIIKSVNLDMVCGINSKLPKNTLPEIALVGRSNVGKSSLINVLINRKAYAKTSSVPGKTQTINFYNVNQKIYLVDLPGYGYTKTARENSDRWAKMINKYLDTSKMLKAIAILLDLRHAPSILDKEMFEWIKNSTFPYIIIGTKMDKIGESKIDTNKEVIRQSLNLNENINIFGFSALKKEGADEIWEEFIRLI